MKIKWILMFIIILLLIPSSSAWSIFDMSIVEDTDNIIIKDIETEWGNYTDGYGYSVEFYVDNINSSHDIDAIISFYNQNNDMIKNFTVLDWYYDEYTEEIYDMEYSEDNLTLPLGESVKYDTSKPIQISGSVHSNETFYNISHIKVDIFDNDENEIIYSLNESFNMSNEHSFDEDNYDSYSDDESDETDNVYYPTKSERDSAFFKETDTDDDGLISFDEFSQISFVFTEDSFWDGYSIEEILQSEWDRANDDGDEYLTFEEFKKVI